MVVPRDPALVRRCEAAEAVAAGAQAEAAAARAEAVAASARADESTRAMQRSNQEARDYKAAVEGSSDATNDSPLLPGRWRVASDQSVSSDRT